MITIAEQAAQLTKGELADTRRLSGGSLSQVVWLRLEDGRELVAKRSPTSRAEAKMLHAISLTGALAPLVVAVEDDLLVMECVASGGQLSGSAWESLADALARLHAPNGASYGWDADHSFADVSITNARTEHWPDFWADRRLRCHLPFVGRDLGRRIECLAGSLDDRLPARPHSVLLHGDLWGGNVLVHKGRVSALIDPACYFGDREVDIAMLSLFDRPPERFFAALDLDGGWRDRLPIYRLWPLLVHLRLFGGGYAGQIMDALDEVGV